MQVSIEEMYLLKKYNEDFDYVCDGDKHIIEVIKNDLLNDFYKDKSCLKYFDELGE